MENMKMSDVFNGELVQDADTLFANGYGELADFSGYKKEARYVAHAVNNHDQLVEENAELREMLEKYISAADSGSFGRMGQCYKDAKELLNK